MTDDQKSTAGATGKGAVSGAATGASVGSVIPVWGTAVGAAAGALIGGTSSFLKSKQQQKRARAAANTFQTPQEYKDAVSIAEGLSNSGDPNTARNQQAIEQGQANTVSRVKALSGNVSDVLNVLSSSQKTATDATLANMANDTSFRYNAKRNLANAKMQLGNVNASTQGKNYNAVMGELGRQGQANQAQADSIHNMANDVISSQYLKKYGYGIMDAQGDRDGLDSSDPLYQYQGQNPFWKKTRIGI